MKSEELNLLETIKSSETVYYIHTDKLNCHIRAENVCIEKVEGDGNHFLC